MSAVTKITCPLLLVALLNAAEGLAADTVFVAVNAVPRGFEELSRPQRSLIDVYYGNRLINSQVATFTSDTIRLSNPAAVVRAVPDITDPSLLTNLLTGTLNSNPAVVCAPQQQQNCGLLRPEVAGVVFNENRFRLDLFINRNYLTTRKADVQRYLPPSQAGLALLQNFNGTVSGASGQASNNYTFRGTSQLSWTENNLHFGWNYSKNQKFAVDTLYLQREFEGLAWQGGLINTSGFGLSFAFGRTLLGAKVGTSNRTRTDRDFTSGTELDVFLPVRGRVELLKDGRLLESQFLSAGNHQLNTSGLPDGAYNLEIIIVDEAGRRISREQRFFAKQNRLPAQGEWQWFAEAGQIVSSRQNKAFPQSEHVFMARGGVNRRLSESWSGTLALAANDQRNGNLLAEAGLYHVGENYEFSPTLMHDDQGSFGVALQASYRWQQLSLSANHRRLWSEQQSAATPTPPAPAPAPSPANVVREQQALIGDSFQQTGFSASYPVLGGSASYRYSYNKRLNSNSTRTQGLSWRRSLWRDNDYALSMNINLSRSGRDEVYLVEFDLSARKDNWQFRASPSSQYERRNGRGNRALRTRMTAGWQDGDLLDEDLDVELGVVVGESNRSLNGRARYANHLGNANLSVVNNRPDNGRSTTSYSGSFSTSLMTDGEYFAVGGRQTAESAVLVNIDGKEGDRFDVLINGQRQGYAVAGESTLVPLTPFGQYKIGVQPAGLALYDFDEKQREVTLYPGNVVRMKVDAQPLQLAFGRMMINGEPLANAPVNGGVLPITSDSYGLFQTEIKAGTNNLTVHINDRVCALPLPEKAGEIVRMGTIDMTGARCHSPQDH